MTIIGFDFGTKSIGVAVGQSITGTASILKALKAQDGIPNWNVVEQLLKEWQPERIVVGLPLNMDGTEQPLTQRAKKFGNRIHGRFNIPVDFQDERLTSTAAREALFEREGYRGLEKGKVDSAAALLIVEDYLRSQ
ncbi:MULTISPECIES: Holliday junction resolvase RuvX [unclassified Idiomarina]|uniref:Holliday junction resolvase RuvX n=1 Tax=unclassified Idiomarina TaxID=2614829 RepID=UPI000C8F1506|nr:MULTISPECIES: Holliday junction resolvase RuvX [unclassified Idiomarina]MAD53827.1 Holliday junction resolvase RuvX [Idiomarinaceae bacterium]MEC8925712.1 Holliday junction resolvase RuvX [Pseudomonadota bacterium]NQZ05275.1 Holliday junction resolvase RuvX [Idiomarina sp.]|tara:strand:- start:11190 stop:11597 length:408 start_codon:yes stop_codon:yes gene_type:complete